MKPLELPNAKPWWRSRRMIGFLVLLAGQLLGLEGFRVSPDLAIGVLMDVISAIGAALLAWGSVRATQPISLKQVAPGLTVGRKSDA